MQPMRHSLALPPFPITLGFPQMVWHPADFAAGHATPATS